MTLPPKLRDTLNLSEEEREAELKKFYDWRDAERHKRRIMTIGEYRAWLAGGDILSHPSEGNPFPGGITLELNTIPYIGRTE